MSEGNIEDGLRALSEFITAKKKIAAQPSALEKVMVKYKKKIRNKLG